VTVRYHLRGYDLRTEFLGTDNDIAPKMLPAVCAILPASADDPDFDNPLEINAAEAIRLGELLGVPIDLDRFVYYVESNEDSHVVAAQVQGMRARA